MATDEKKNKYNNNGMLIWGVPPELRESFKKKCSDNHTTMKAVVVKMLEEYVADVGSTC